MQAFEIKNALQTTRLFQRLEPHELEALLIHAKFVSFAPGKMIIKQGSKTDGIYIILEGVAIIAGQMVGEKMVNLASLTAGNIFGGSSVISKGLHATSVLAETELPCLLITTSYFEMLSLFYPSMKYKIMREIAENTCDRLVKVADKIMAVMSSTEMTTRSIFGEVVRSLTKPSLITYEDAGLDRNQLKELDPIASLNDENNEFLQHTHLIRTPNQCTLIEEGEKNTSSYLVLRGAVQSSIVKQNKVAKISILGPLSFFCPLSLINDKLPSIINYTTCERAILLKIEKSYLDELQLNHSKVWHKLFDKICESFVILGKYTDKLDIRINSEIYNR